MRCCNCQHPRSLSFQTVRGSESGQRTPSTEDSVETFQDQVVHKESAQGGPPDCSLALIGAHWCKKLRLGLEVTVPGFLPRQELLVLGSPI